MSNVTIIGIDLAKRIFHAHGACSDGSVAFRSRGNSLAAKNDGSQTTHAMALANKMARSIWAMLTKQEDYRHPGSAAA